MRGPRTTDTIVIGAGQAGLSLGRLLARGGSRHALLERGRVGERWRSERWDSLRLLTPNWLNRLDGGPVHADADGFLSRSAFVDYLHRYGRRSGSPIHQHVDVQAVEQTSKGFHVSTDAGAWLTQHVVVATGDSADASVPSVADTAPCHLRQLHSSEYRNPHALPTGGVLVVGAGPSGQQIAAELARAGRSVVLSVGRHTRAVRRYRGRDILFWLDALGLLEQSIDDVPDPVAAVRAPSLALTGLNGGEQLDLGVLSALGVTIAGRLRRFDETGVSFEDDLPAATGDAERRLTRVLDRIDDHVERVEPGWEVDADRPAPVVLPPAPLRLDLAAAGITTVIWATGYRRLYPWLHLPVLDDAGEIAHWHGITEIPGLYLLGRRFQRCRASNFIGRVGDDALHVASLIARSSRATHVPGPGSKPANRSFVPVPLVS